MKQTLTLTSILFCFCMAACQNNRNMIDKFYWNPGQSAPNYYPVETSNIFFAFADGGGVGGLGAISGYGGNSWGINTAGAAVGREFKPVPIRLDITYLSYAENKFYTGSFKLPYHTMLSLFQKGWPDFNYSFNPPKPITDTYNEIIVGMAPGGMVVVWLSGAGYKTEVGSFQAHDTIIAMPTFIDMIGSGHSPENDDQSIFVSRIMKDSAIAENFKVKGLPLGLWQKYRQKFNIKPTLVYDQLVEVNTYNMQMDFYNGEQYYWNLADIKNTEYGLRARINKVIFNWFIPWAGKNQGFQLDIRMDEEEIMQAYEEVYGKPANGQGELLVQINRGNDQYKIFLQGNGKKIELKKTQGEIMLNN